MSALPIHTTGPQKRSVLAQILQEYPGSSAAAQCQRIREALSRFACTSVELVRYLDCYDANARLHELRHRHGVGIGMGWVRARNEEAPVKTEASEGAAPGLITLHRDSHNDASLPACGCYAKHCPMEV